MYTSYYYYLYIKASLTVGFYIHHLIIFNISPSNSFLFTTHSNIYSYLCTVVEV